MRWPLVMVLALCCAGLSAQGVGALRVGNTATEINAASWLEVPEKNTLAEFEGDVVVLIAWGLESKPAVRAAQKLSKMLDERPDKGLHVIGLYSELQPLSEVREFTAKNGIHFPQALDFDGAAYEAKSLPRIWIIDAFGGVRFIGAKDFEDKIDESLTTVKFPGLNARKLSAALHPAAEALARRDYSQAHRLATEAAAQEGASDAILNDADKVQTAVKERMNLLRNRAETASIQCEYRLALRAYDELLARFKDLLDEPEAVAKAAADLRADKKTQAEINARDAFIELARKLTREYANVRRWADALDEFVGAHKDTRAAEEAADLAKLYRPRDGK